MEPVYVPNGYDENAMGMGKREVTEGRDRKGE